METPEDYKKRMRRIGNEKYRNSEKGKAAMIRGRVTARRKRKRNREERIAVKRRMETVKRLLEEARRAGKDDQMSKAACLAAMYHESMAEQRQPALLTDDFNFSDSLDDLSNRRLSHVVRSTASSGTFKFLNDKGDLCPQNRRVAKLERAFESGFCEIKELDGKENFDSIEPGERRDLLNVASIGRGSKLLVIGNDVLLCDVEINIYEFNEVDFAGASDEKDSGMEIVESENFVMQADGVENEEWSSKLTEIYANGEFKHREEQETVQIPEALRKVIEMSALTERTLGLLRKDVENFEGETSTEGMLLKSNDDDIFRDYQPEDKSFTVVNANPDTSATLAEILMCPVCRKVFQSIEEWHEHRNSTSSSINKGERALSCCIDGCNQRFHIFDSSGYNQFELGKFIKHIQQHYGEKICRKCWKLCDTPETAERHCPERKGFNCWKCQETFKLVHYGRHLFRTRLCVEAVIGRMCRWCKTEFDTHEEAVVHEQARRSRDRFACCSCEFSAIDWTK